MKTKKFNKMLIRAMGTSTNGDSLEGVLSWMQRKLHKACEASDANGAELKGARNRLRLAEDQIGKFVERELNTDPELRFSAINVLRDRQNKLDEQIQKLLVRQENLDKRMP